MLNGFGNERRTTDLCSMALSLCRNGRQENFDCGIFEARHWRLRPGMSVYPSRNAATGLDFNHLYRLRVNGRWFGPRRLSFFSMVEAAALVERVLKIKDIDKVEKEVLC